MATKTSPAEDNRDEMKANCAPTTSPSNQLLENDQENPPLGPGLYMVPKERLKSFLREETIGAGGSMSSSTSVFHGFQSRDLVRPRALTELGERVAKGARAKSPVKSPVIDLTQFSPSPEKARPAPQVPSVKTAMPTPSGVDRRPSVPCEYRERLLLAGQLLKTAEERHAQISQQLGHLSMVLKDIHRQQFEWQRHLELVRECIKYEDDDPFYD